MPGSGSTTIDFGAFPGVSDATKVITGQAGILSGSLVEAWILPADTSDHLSDEHLVETIKVIAGKIVAGTGFTIYAFNTSQKNEPLAPGGEGPAATATVGAQSGDGAARVGGVGTRIYGKFNVAWAWT